MLLRSTAASINRSTPGFVRPTAAVRTSAPTPVPGRFRPPLPVLAVLAYASASSVRIEISCPTPVFHVRPFAPIGQLLWPRLTSDDPSRHLSMPVAQGRSSDLPGYCALTFTLIPVGSTSRHSVQELGFASICPLTPPGRLYPLPVRQASALPTASSRFRLATDTLAVQLTLPLAGCVEDFHLQVNAPCRAHKSKAARIGGSNFPLLAYSCSSLAILSAHSCSASRSRITPQELLHAAHIDLGKVHHIPLGLDQLLGLLQRISRRAQHRQRHHRRAVDSRRTLAQPLRLRILQRLYGKTHAPLKHRPGLRQKIIVDRIPQHCHSHPFAQRDRKST